MYTDEQILKRIQGVASRLKSKSVSLAQFEKYCKISQAAATKHFGSWNKAVAAAGLEPIDPANSTTRLSDEELLLDLIRLFNETGDVPSKHIISVKGKYSVGPYNARWRGAKNAIAVARRRFPEEFRSSSSAKGKTASKRVPAKARTKRPKAAGKRLGLLGWLAVSAALGGFGPTTSVGAESVTQRPNVLWITCEDISPNLGCFGDNYARTPVPFSCDPFWLWPLRSQPSEGIFDNGSHRQSRLPGALALQQFSTLMSI